MAGALHGVRVVDLSAMFAGPFATALLAEQGADVIKVEPPGRGDLIRHVGVSRAGLGAIFNTMNRGKRSVAIDLGHPEGRALVERLVARADVFVENFRPGTVERLGLDEPALRRVRPDLVYVSITGFGERGPYARRRVYDSIMQALCGLAALQWDEGAGEPRLVKNAICDKVTALTAAQAITAALLVRERGGGGQHVRIAMLDACVAFLWPDGMQDHTYLPADPAPRDSYGGLRCRRTADGFVVVSAVQDGEFAGLCGALGRRDLLEDPRFADAPSRLLHARALWEILEALLREHSTAALCERLAAEDVPHAPVNRPATLHEDPQVVASALLVESEHPVAGRMRAPRPAARFDATPSALGRPAPRLGEHTEEVLRELGVEAAELRALRTRGVISRG